MTKRRADQAESPIAPGFRIASVRRFFEKVDTEGPCWEWTACRNSQGYGRVTVDGLSQYAHRNAWQMLVGPIPIGLELDHLCRNRGCVNPDHLEPVTPAENTRRGASRVLVHNAREARYGRGPWVGSRQA